jgi:uncharacterized protein (AIM24 family)
MVMEDDLRLSQSDDTRDQSASWIEKAKLAAVGGHSLVLEDGPVIVRSGSLVSMVRDVDYVRSKDDGRTGGTVRKLRKGRGRVKASGTGNQET